MTFLTTTVTVTASQIEHLTTVPVTLIAAPGLGSVIWVLNYTINYLAATPYTLNDTESLNIQTNGYDWDDVPIPTVGFMDQTTNQVFTQLGEPQIGAPATLINEPLVLNNAGGGSNFAGGTSTLLVTVTYLVLTGQ